MGRLLPFSKYVNEVTPLTADDALDRLRLSMRQGSVSAVAMLTDGLENLCINRASGQPYPPFFVPFFEAIVKPMDTAKGERQLASFLNSDRVCSKTEDDKTLLVAGRLSQYGEKALPGEQDPLGQRGDLSS